MLKWYKNPLTWYVIVCGVAGIVSALTKVDPTLGWLAVANAALTQILGWFTQSGIVTATKSQMAQENRV